MVGKITPTTKRSSSYFVTFTDDYSRYTVVYPMKAKSEVLLKFDKYRHMAENLHKTKVKTYRTDNGGEYTSKEFNQYLAKHCIRHQLTIPGTPECHQRLWADTVLTASHIRNKGPCKAVGGESPESLWTGVKVKLDNLKMFGCKAWCVRNKRCKGKKLEPLADECILVGYPELVKGYKLWNQKEDNIFVCRDFTFEEESFPCKLTQVAMKLKSVRALLAIAVERNRKIHQMDTPAAYLNGILKQTVYMEEPQPFNDCRKDEVCLLKKTLTGYGSLEWSGTLLFTKCSKEKQIRDFESRLGKEFDARELGEASHILSIRLKEEKDGKLTLDETAHANNILETFGMSDAKPVSSHLDPGSKYQIGDNNNPSSADLPRKYRQAIGALL
ncbi:uncharacterized protein [Dermacentor andersoni]|uniref:uncharacterized protein n=1 Tax=Dermacentor andersoni TaxID=34620 RepID=UPI003B3BA069